MSVTKRRKLLNSNKIRAKRISPALFIYNVSDVLLDLDFLRLDANFHEVYACVIHCQVEVCGVRTAFDNDMALQVEHFISAANADTCNLDVATDSRQSEMRYLGVCWQSILVLVAGAGFCFA